MKKSRAVTGIMITAIPFYVVGGFVVGLYLGQRAGNPTIGVVLGLLAGIALAFYDIYVAVIAPFYEERNQSGHRD